MAKKQKKKRNKKYRPNYTTGGRVDMRTGGRVGYQIGKRVEDPREEEMSIDRLGGGRTTVEPQPVGQPRRTTEPVPEPVPEPVLTSTPTPTPSPVDDFDNFATPKGKPGEYVADNTRDNRTITKMPEQPNPRDSMIFVEDSQEENGGPTDSQTDQTSQSTSTPMSREDFFRQYGDYTGSTRGSAGAKARNNFIAERQKAYEEYLRNFSNNSNNSSSTTITGNQQQFEDERGKRIIQSGRTAQDIAAGNIPEGTIPQMEAEKISMEGTTADTVTFDPTKQAEATTIDQTAPEQVATMDATTAQTPEQIKAAQMEASQIDTDVQIDAAQGELSDDAVAQAAGVERVAPTEGADVTIQEGALANRVIGTLSPEAKAEAAKNAGTNLARVTRAKKQLRNVGLSEEDITELGNDPEALEARLTDFTEQQRGIIEGLPEEALVSNQLDSLLSGIEEGEIPTWAKPAVASVEAMLARRGLTASSVGRDNLFNAIIQSAIPLAQSNAQAIQQSVSQQRNIEAAVSEANTQREQQAVLTNAKNVFTLNMAQFSADQQTEIANSKFLQTVSLAEASNDQKSILQNAVLMSQANIAEANFNQQAQIQNAKNFLAIDMANLNNQQQANVLKAQQEQQRLLSNQSSENAARQFNAASENQINQFMASLASQTEQFNTAQVNASAQFNVQQQNAASARDAQRIADVNKANAAIINQAEQFNTQLEFNRQQWNAANEQAVLNSNVNWRRQSNTANTAAQNAANQQNVQNAFSLTSSALSFLWQELRDQADYDFRAGENAANRKLQAMIAAASAEGDAAKYWSSNFTSASSTINSIFGIG